MAWIDVRSLPDSAAAAVIEEAVHSGAHAVVADDPRLLEQLPATVCRVLFPAGGRAEEANADVLVERVADAGQMAALRRRDASIRRAAYVEVADPSGLELACRCARDLRTTVLRFADPTKIPLEIVLAEAAAGGEVITVVADLTEADIVLRVLERGPHGVMLWPGTVGEATELVRLCRGATPDLTLEELEVVSAEHCGFGDRACVDTCSYLRQDEGMLVGSFSQGMILCCSETHPLPYMPTRPFRVNAGALHSYVLCPGDRTRYLCELEAGSQVLAVGACGRARPVTVGRVKIESRPLRHVLARSRQGTMVSLVLQDDWHVRVLCQGGTVASVTELGAGSRVLGHVAVQARHVGIPIREFLLEQ